MMKPENNYYITTAIAYTSRKPHIGNSYEIVLTDAIARYQRLLGKNVFFQNRYRRTRPEDRRIGGRCRHFSQRICGRRSRGN